MTPGYAGRSHWASVPSAEFENTWDADCADTADRHGSIRIELDWSYPSSSAASAQSASHVFVFLCALCDSVVSSFSGRRGNGQSPRFVGRPPHAAEGPSRPESSIVRIV